MLIIDSLYNTIDEREKERKGVYARDACMCCFCARAYVCARGERERVCDKEGRRRVTS